MKRTSENFRLSEGEKIRKLTRSKEMRYSKNFRVLISDKYSEKLIKLRTTRDRAMYTENNYGGPICLLYFSHVLRVALSTVPCLNLNHSSLFYFMSKCKVFKALSNVADVRVPSP